MCNARAQLVIERYVHYCCDELHEGNVIKLL